MPHMLALATKVFTRPLTTLFGPFVAIQWRILVPR